MIDRPELVERLMPKLEAELPMPARVTPELAGTLRADKAFRSIPLTCAITWISYGGDEAGILCKLDFGPGVENAAFASITHLRFDPRLPLAREIIAYQKHRVKRLQRQAA